MEKTDAFLINKTWTFDQVLEWVTKNIHQGTDACDIIQKRVKDNWMDGESLLNLSTDDVIHMFPEIGLRQAFMRALQRGGWQNQIPAALPSVSGIHFQVETSRSASPFSTTSQDSACSQGSEGEERSPVGYPAPTPKFSDTVLAVLKGSDKSKVLAIMDDIISESASFYLPITPTDTVAAKTSYENIGKTMVKKYPLLTMDGPTAWHFFNTKLSAKMRNTRNRKRLKIRRLLSACEPQKKMAKDSSVATVVESPEVLEAESQSEDEEEDDEAMKCKLKQEKLKESPDMKCVKKLMTKTFSTRQTFIRSKPSTDLKLSLIIQEYPWLSEPSVLELEMELLGHKAETFKANFMILVEKIEGLQKTGYDLENPESQLDLIKMAEERMNTGRRKKKGSSVILVESKDVKDSTFRTKEGEEPAVVFIIDGRDVRSGIIVGDGIKMCLTTGAGVVWRSLFLLLACYYMLNLNFSKNSMSFPLLLLLQERCLEEAVTVKDKTTAYKLYVSRLDHP